MDYTLFNVASIVLGIAAIIIPFTQNKVKISNMKIIISFSFCLIAIGCQLVYQDYLVGIRDWTAIEDTSGALLNVSIGLIALTILVNVLSVYHYKRKSSLN